MLLTAFYISHENCVKIFLLWFINNCLIYQKTIALRALINMTLNLLVYINHSYTTSNFITLYFLRVLILWYPLLIIVLYHQTKTSINFWYRWELKLRSLIQPSETYYFILTILLMHKLYYLTILFFLPNIELYQHTTHAQTLLHQYFFLQDLLHDYLDILIWVVLTCALRAFINCQFQKKINITFMENTISSRESF